MNNRSIKSKSLDEEIGDLIITDIINKYIDDVSEELIEVRATKKLKSLIGKRLLREIENKVRNLDFTYNFVYIKDIRKTIKDVLGDV